jgi:hypothetical protein
MFLLLHILIALSSIAFTSYLFVAPTRRNFQVSYALIGLTLASGTYLVISTHARLLASCETGLIYIGVVLFGLIGARYRAVKSIAFNRKNKTD